MSSLPLNLAHLDMIGKRMQQEQMVQRGPGHLNKLMADVSEEVVSDEEPAASVAVRDQKKPKAKCSRVGGPGPSVTKKAVTVVELDPVTPESAGDADAVAADEQASSFAQPSQQGVVAWISSGDGQAEVPLVLERTAEKNAGEKGTGRGGRGRGGKGRGKGKGKKPLDDAESVASEAAPEAQAQHDAAPTEKKKRTRASVSSTEFHKYKKLGYSSESASEKAREAVCKAIDDGICAPGPGSVWGGPGVDTTAKPKAMKAMKAMKEPSAMKAMKEPKVVAMKVMKAMKKQNAMKAVQVDTKRQRTPAVIDRATALKNKVAELKAAGERHSIAAAARALSRASKSKLP